MTSSFTTMLLVAARLFGVHRACAVRAPARTRIRRGADVARELVDAGFDRIVYLGGNALHGLAREAALKMLELTDGQVVAMHETPLGFRHGPKTIVNESTLVVMFISNDPLVRAYDLDLLRELRGDGRARRVFAIGAQRGRPRRGRRPRRRRPGGRRRVRYDRPVRRDRAAARAAPLGLAATDARPAQPLGHRQSRGAGRRDPSAWRSEG